MGRKWVSAQAKIEQGLVHNNCKTDTVKTAEHEPAVLAIFAPSRVVSCNEGTAEKFAATEQM